MSPEINPCLPLSDPQHLYRLIQKVFVLLDDYDQRILDHFSLNTSQYRTLLLLDSERGERLTTISERLLLSKSTITRVIDELENRSWVQRIPDPDDRRAQRVVLTSGGAQMRSEVCNVHQQALGEAFQHLSQNEQKRLDDLLESLCNSIQVSLNGNVRGET